MQVSNNGGDSGGAVNLFHYCSIRFSGHSKVKFDDNGAIHSGGVMYFYGHSEISSQGNTTVI